MYKQGNKYKVTFDGEEKHFRYTYDVADFIIKIATFAVDYYELSESLKALNKNESMLLENKYVIERIA
ncbi:hypothetical protein [Lysinibacillus pakistanensis]|uniref:hypothetical protein n=1 Tax=Lysinibacillus pakistanensis TaxID=759811 RepID=UPI003D2A428C